MVCEEDQAVPLEALPLLQVAAVTGRNGRDRSEKSAHTALLRAMELAAIEGDPGVLDVHEASFRAEERREEGGLSLRVILYYIILYYIILQYIMKSRGASSVFTAAEQLQVLFLEA